MSTIERENDDVDQSSDDDSNQERELRLLTVFNSCDHNQKGYLCVDDIAVLVGSGSGVDVGAIFDQLDGDRDGKVTWEDFKGGWVSIVSAGNLSGDHIDGGGPPPLPSSPPPSSSLVWSSDSEGDEADSVFNVRQQAEVQPKYVLSSGKRFGRRSRPETPLTPDSPPRSKLRLSPEDTTVDLVQQMAGVKTTTSLSIFGLENMGHPSPLIQKRTFTAKFGRRDSPLVVTETGDYTREVSPFETSAYSIQSQSPSNDEMEMIEKLFKTFDDDGDGLIDRADFTQVCASLAMATKDEDIESLFDQLDEDKDGRVSVSDFSKGLTVVKETYALESAGLTSPTGGERSDFSYSSPLLVPRMSTPSARAATLMSKKTAVEDLFHQLDTDQTGLVSRDSLISVWLDQTTDPHNEQTQQITRFLQDLETDERGYVSMEEVTFGLQALLTDDHSPGVHDTVLRIYLTGIRHLRARLTNVVFERDKIRSDLARLGEEKAQLVRVGDDEAEQVRREHRRELDECERRCAERVQTLEREIRAERESWIVQAQKQAKEKEDELEIAKGHEELLKEKLKEADMNYQMLEEELREQEAENKSLRRDFNQLHRELQDHELERSTTDLDRVLADYEDDDHRRDLLEQVQDLQRLNKELRDKVDESKAEIESYKQQLIAERRKAGRRRKSSGAGVIRRTSSKVGDYVRRRKDSSSSSSAAAAADEAGRSRESSHDDGIGPSPAPMERDDDEDEDEEDGGGGGGEYDDDDDDTETKMKRYVERIKELEADKFHMEENFEKERATWLEERERIVDKGVDSVDDGGSSTQKQIKDLVIEREQLRLQANRLEAEFALAQDEKAALLARISDLEIDCRELKSSVDALESERRQATLLTQAESTENARLKLEMETMRGHVDRARKASAAEVTTIRDSFEAEKAERARQRVAVEVELNRLRSETTTLTTERDELLDENRALVEEIETLRETEQVLRGEYDGVVDEQTKLVCERDGLYEERERAAGTASALENRVGELEEKLALCDADWRDRVDLVKAQFDRREAELRARVDELCATRDALNDSVVELSERNEATFVEKSRLEARLDEFAQRDDEAADRVQARLTESEAKRAAIVQDRNQLEEKVANLQEDLSSSTQEAEFWQSQAKLFEESLRERDDTLNETTTRVDDEIRALREEASRLTELVEEKDSHVAGLELCLGRYSAESTEQRLLLEAEHERRMAAVVMENENLRHSKTSRIMNNSTLERDLEALEERNSSLVRALALAEKKERDLVDGYRNLLNQKDALIRLVSQVTLASLQ